MSTWVTADWHLDHKNVLKYDDRPWDDIEQMNCDIITAAANFIKEEDSLIYLGDLALTHRERYVDWLKIMKYLWPNLVFIHGNHDKGINSSVWEEAGIMIRTEYRMDEFIFTHAPILKVPKNKVNIHGHTHKPSVDTSHLSVSVNVTGYLPVSVK